MQLEKVTSQSGEAGLAGWISSNDVTLFTVVMVLVIAIFLQTSLTRGAKKNVQLEAVNVSLSDRNLAARQGLAGMTSRLQETESDLQAVRSELSAATASLEQTRQELDAAAGQLAATRGELSRTSQQRDEADRLRRELDQRLLARQADVERLQAALSALEIEKGGLLESRSELTAATEELARQRDHLDQSLAELALELKQKLEQLDDLRRERDLLDEQSRALAERVAGLEQQLGNSRRELADLRQSGQTEVHNLQALLARALQESQLAEAAAREEASDNKRLLQLQIEALKTQLANALDGLRSAEEQLALQQRREKTVHRELLGLRGDLRRVAILLDASGSMNQDGRWQEVQQIAATWLDHLDVQECVLIVFASDVTAYPADGSLSTLSGPGGDAHRAGMLQYLQSVEPKGWTNTLAAMHRAYAHTDIDTIILFSDGAPTEANSSRFDTGSAEQIYALCRQNSHIPVNVVGLGNYFDPEFATFLRSMAGLTGGTFVGR